MGGNALSLLGANFSSGVQVRFGNSNPVAAVATGSAELQVTSPPSTASGPVNLTAYFSNGWMTLAPSAFSYGPKIISVLPNAGSISGGDPVTIYGYGFGAGSNGTTVNIGSQTATIVSVDPLAAVVTALALDSSYPFPLERIVLKVPAGSADKTDITLTTGAGFTTASKAFQYLPSNQTFANPGLHKFIVYEPTRQRLYLSATDHVDVFDLASQVFVSPITPPPNGPPPDAALRGLAFTPDHSQLLVADFGAQHVYMINPDGSANNGTAVNVGGVSGFLNSGPARVAATSVQTVFVGLSGEGTPTGSCSNCLGQMNLMASPPLFQPAPQAEVTSLTGAPLLQADAAGDAAYLAYDSSPGGPVGVWNAASPNTFSISTARNTATDFVTGADGTFFALRTRGAPKLRAQDLTLLSSPSTNEIENVPNRVAVPGLALHPSGALVFEPFLDGPLPDALPATGIRGGIDIRDAHNGQLRLRVYLPEPFAMLSTDVDGLHGQFLTTDENGQRLFALTVRGSGFQSGMKATLGGKSASVSFKDVNKITITTPALTAGPQQLGVTNPDGESVSLDAAFFAQ